MTLVTLSAEMIVVPNKPSSATVPSTPPAFNIVAHFVGGSTCRKTPAAKCETGRPRRCRWRARRQRATRQNPVGVDAEDVQNRQHEDDAEHDANDRNEVAGWRQFDLARICASAFLISFEDGTDDPARPMIHVAIAAKHLESEVGARWQASP